MARPSAIMSPRPHQELVGATPRPVPQGPVAYRRRIRRFGPFAGLLLPAIVFVAALAVWRIWPCDGSACVKNAQVGWVLASLAAPTALIAGFPMENGTARLAAAGAGAVVLWLAIGSWAARRSARLPVAGWREWWREYLWLLVPVWCGTVAALAIMRYVAL